MFQIDSKSRKSIYEQVIDNIKEQKEYAIKDSARIYLGQSLLYADSAQSSF